MKRYKLTAITFIILIPLLFAQNNWQTQNSGTNRELTDVCFIDANNGWISGWTGTILHTTDGGQTWNQQNPPPNNAYYSVFFTDALNGWACGYSGKIIHTTDGGQNWFDQVSPVDTDLYDIHFINASTGWIIGGDNGVFPSLRRQRTILYTSDGGNSWISQYNQSQKSLLKGIYFKDEQTGFATGEWGIIMHTSNGGIDWNEASVISSFHFFDVYSSNGNNSWVVGKYLGVPHYAAIFKSTDSGSSWTETQLGTDENLVGIHFPDELNGWAVGGDINNNGVVYRTSDGGENWVRQNIPTVKYLFRVLFINENIGWSVGHQGTIVATESVVPVELTSFSAKVINNNVELKWSTATETNNQGFSVERRIAENKEYNSDWKSLGFIDGTGTTTKKQNYTFVDNNLQSGNYFYRLVQIDFDGTKSESEIINVEIYSQPTGYTLNQNYPNPFNPTTKITYSIPKISNVKITVYDQLGNKISTLVNEQKESGNYEIDFDAGSFSSGVYFYRIEAGSFTSTKQMLLLK